MRRSKLTTLLVTAMVLAMSMTAFAEDHNVQSDTSVNVTVSASVGTDFTVTVPKTVALTNAQDGSGEWTATFKTTAEGDIGTAQVLEVKPAVTSFKLTSDANVEADCAVTAGTTLFERDDLNTGTPAEATHSLSATLTPGTWSGTFAFNIELKNK